MMTRSLLVLLLALLTASLSACASRPEGARSDGAGAAVSQHTLPPAGSSLAKVQKGMDDAQVRKILGDPAESKSYMTGKAFIPFYFGPDTHRADWVYPGVGRVVFSRNRWSGGLSVIQVVSEPTKTAGAR